MNKYAEAHQFAHPHQLLKGIGFSLLAWLFVAVMIALARYAQESVSVVLVLFFQNALGALLTYPSAHRYHLASTSKIPWGLLFIRCVSGQLTLLFQFLAITYISLTETLLLTNSAPIFLPFISFIWLRNKIRAVIFPGIVIGFVGIYLILKPGSAVHHNIGEVYGLLAAISLAVIMLSLRLLSLSMKAQIIMFYFMLSGTIVFGVLSIFFWSPLSWFLVGILISIGFINFLAQYCLTRSYNYGEPSQLSPFSYSAIIYALGLDWILYKIKPDLLSVIGILLVCTGGIITILLTTPRKKA